jgi:TPR repeat protein
VSTAVQYVIVKELARSAGVQVCRVKTAEKSDGSLVLKRCVPPDNGLVDRKAMLRSFLDKARAQQAVAAVAGSRWVKIHEVSDNGAGAYFLSDYFEASAQKLITGQVRLGHGALLALVRSVLDGLAQMHAASERHHGNLKPSNVLIAGTDEIEDGDVFLCDPSDANDPAAHDGAADDLFQVGQLIHQLVLHRPFRPVTGWPVEPSAAWSRLGHAGKRWRDFCNHLLHPDALARPGSLAEARRELDRVARRPVTHTAAYAAATVLLVAALGGGAFLYQRHTQIRRDAQALEAAYGEWFPDFSDVALSDSFRRSAERDPYLKEHVLAPRQFAQRADPDGSDSLRPSRVRDLTRNPPGVFDRERATQLRADLELVRRIGDGIRNWDFLRRLGEYRVKYEQREWTHVARYLADQIARATPPSKSVGATIDSLMEQRGALESGLAEIEKVWAEIDSQRALIRGRAAGSEMPPKFADYLSRAAAGYTADIDGPADLKKFHAHLQNVLSAARGFANELPDGWAKDVDVTRLREYEKAFPQQPSPADFFAWSKRLPDYRPFPLPPDRLAQLGGRIRDAQQTVDEMEELSRAPQADARNRVDPAKLEDYKRGLPALRASLTELGTPRFLRVDQDKALKELDELGRRVERYSSEVVGELARIKPEPVGDWRKAALGMFDGDERLAAAWRGRLGRRIPDQEVARLVKDLGTYLAARQKVAAWATEYAALPNRFPEPSATGDGEFDGAMRDRRGAALAEALRLFDEADEPKFDDPRVAQLGQDYRQWVQNTQQVFAQCRAARQLLDAGAAVGAKGPSGVSLADLESDLKAAADRYRPPSPVGTRVAGIVGEIANLREVDARVAALEQEAEALRQNDDLPAARDRYEQIAKLRPNDRDVAAKRDELAAAVAQRARAMLDRAAELAGANDLDAAAATLADLDRLSPGLPKAEELRRELGRRREEIERGKGVERRIQQARSLLRQGKPNEALEALANDQASADAARLRREIQELKNASGQAVRAADQYFEEGNYRSALELYGKAAEGGNAYAMFRLGLMFREGIGTAKRAEDARGWFLRAAEGNEPGAMRALVQGIGRVQADGWVKRLQSLASGNDARAQFHLGEMYRLGEIGDEPNPSKAVQYYQRAADNGSGAAAYRLALIWESGEGDRQPSLAQARIWYDKAARLGNAAAAQWLDEHPPEQSRPVRNPPPPAPSRTKRNPWVKNPEFQ